MTERYGWCLVSIGLNAMAAELEQRMKRLCVPFLFIVSRDTHHGAAHQICNCSSRFRLDLEANLT